MARLKDHFERANFFHASRDYKAAGDEIQQIFRLAPDMPEAHFNMGNLQRDAGHLSVAAEAFQNALQLARNEGREYPEALLNLAGVLTALKQFDAARHMLAQVLQINPAKLEAYQSLGILYNKMGNYVAADRAYADALAIEPDNMSVLENRAMNEYRSGRPHEALATYNHIHATAPNIPDYRLHRAMILLLHGRYEEGFTEYEARWQTWHFVGEQVRTGMPEWQGQSLVGKTIIAYGEQGFGDTIQFARYIPMLAARAAIVVALVKSPVQDLIATVPGVVQTATIGGGTVPPHDYVVPLLSLPHRLGMMPDKAAPQIPYLFVPKDRVEYWGQRLAGLNGLKIGVVWAGRPEYQFDDSRSTSLAMLAPLLALEGASFVSLQQGAQEEQTADNLFRPGPLADFLETAAIVQSLDLVISVDTAICHLAGALGKEIWTMLPYVPEWRWGLTGEKTPWYPTMRLFRQPDPDDWNEVVSRIRDEILQKTVN